MILKIKTKIPIEQLNLNLEIKELFPKSNIYEILSKTTTEERRKLYDNDNIEEMIIDREISEPL